MFDSWLDTEHGFDILRSMGRTRVRYRRAVAVVVTVSAAVALRGAVGAVDAPRAVPAAERLYVVRAGDTVWSVAASMAGDGDPRPVVDVIIRDNHITDARIWAGERLRVGG
jgi:hypothetical protein